ncbi:hypothetical protein I5192_18800 (plasmid) [Ruegeria sp. SCSIO 43209]|uniref:hypothetical protein n=1 Tax=Ruegeria sp. SCSIO 43209 TaxID=2793010 RepID=UPI001CAA12AD|nr:hypothetical protein [Ruegeria sp. SCSIO 43209]UAB90993.1 hypothetical protein I5192_18800 [Ruegeria sp. SCSIO 43209]
MASSPLVCVRITPVVLTFGQTVPSNGHSASVAIDALKVTKGTIVRVPNSVTAIEIASAIMSKTRTREIVVLRTSSPDRVVCDRKSRDKIDPDVNTVLSQIPLKAVEMA